MSHELRTPLNSLLILADQLSQEPGRQPDGAPDASSRKTIHSSGTDLLMLINDILDLSKIESGTVVGRRRRAAASATSRDFVDRTFRHVADAKSLAFSLELGAELPRALQHGREARCSRCSRTCSPTPSSSPSRAACRAVGRARARGLEPRERVARRRASRCSPSPCATPASASRREAADHLRGVPAGGRQHQPPLRRHRPRPRDQPRDRAAARRRASA